MNIISENGLNVTLVEKLKKEFHVVTIKPYKDEYKISSCYVNINSQDIDKEEVGMFAGFDEDFDAEEFAAACVEYYGERFWGGSVGYVNEEEAKAALKRYSAA